MAAISSVRFGIEFEGSSHCGKDAEARAVKLTGLTHEIFTTSLRTDNASSSELRPVRLQWRILNPKSTDANEKVTNTIDLDPEIANTLGKTTGKVLKLSIRVFEDYEDPSHLIMHLDGTLTPERRVRHLDLPVSLGEVPEFRAGDCYMIKVQSRENTHASGPDRDFNATFTKVDEEVLEKPVTEASKAPARDSEAEISARADAAIRGSGIMSSSVVIERVRALKALIGSVGETDRSPDVTSSKVDEEGDEAPAIEMPVATVRDMKVAMTAAADTLYSSGLSALNEAGVMDMPGVKEWVRMTADLRHANQAGARDPILDALSFSELQARYTEIRAELDASKLSFEAACARGEDTKGALQGRMDLRSQLMVLAAALNRKEVARLAAF